MADGKRNSLTGMVLAMFGGAKTQIPDGNSAWMPPGEPLLPIATPEVVGRRFDYPVSINTVTTPRNYEQISFRDLRNLADTYDLLRMAIETRKDQLETLHWNIKPKDTAIQPDARCKEIEDFFAMPDKENDWATWLRMVVEDVLVIDAPTLFARKTRGGKIYSLEPIDGSTIKRIITEDGRTPLPPYPAYQQILKGVVANNYTRDEMVYFPRNPRTNKIYGLSPVEQVIVTVNIAIRRQIHQLDYYTKGNVPDTIMEGPDNWSTEQIREFQIYWDKMVNSGQRRELKVVPGGVKFNFTKETTLKDDYDEWLARVICYCFSLPPTAFTKQMNRATADNAKQQAEEEGLAPLMNWVKRLINRLILQYWGYSDLEFEWQKKEDVDPFVQAQTNAIYLVNGVITPNEVRGALGLDPLTPEQLEELKPAPAPDVPQEAVGMDQGEEHAKLHQHNHFSKKKNLIY